jgi:endonuclease YncB( thermonuclease family)
VTARVSTLTALLVPLLAFAQHAPPARPFQPFDGCIYKPQRWNDGDSFHVILPDKKEVIFRLYFVDRPEEERVYADRIAEQADCVLFLHPKPEVVYLVVANRRTGACSKANPAEGVVRFGQTGNEGGFSVD